MKHKFEITGLDCPHCAEKLATLIAGKDGIEEAKINFLTEKLTVTSEMDGEAVYAACVAAAKEFSKDVKIEK